MGHKLHERLPNFCFESPDRRHEPPVEWIVHSNKGTRILGLLPIHQQVATTI